VEIATPSPPEEPAPTATTGALTTPPAEDGEAVAGSPTVGELAEGETPDPEEQAGTATDVPGIGEEDPDELSAESLFDPAATARIVALWVITPSISVVGAYVLFYFVA
jgi:PiT family inorganic phosphate transporter